ncbi:hypothetical protein ACFSGX_06685 [Sphingomonas arantia]|uniref:Uncharacterized protein n=1 Tax=Sphingomonas arantia TaxID=1460676 RepID=A0ABW4TWT7_9SPHN
MAGLLAELEAIPQDDDLTVALDAKMEAWQARAVGLDGVEAILTFLTRHPHLDVGNRARSSILSSVIIAADTKRPYCDRSPTDRRLRRPGCWTA